MLVYLSVLFSLIFYCSPNFLSGMPHSVYEEIKTIGAKGFHSNLGNIHLLLCFLLSNPTLLHQTLLHGTAMNESNKTNCRHDKDCFQYSTLKRFYENCTNVSNHCHCIRMNLVFNACRG